MAPDKKKVCKECGFLTNEKVCPNCESTSFLDKYKGCVAIFDSKKSVVSEKLGIEKNGMFALKYN